MNTDKLERFPLNATFELTARCNLKCKMCLIRVDHSRMAELGGRERTTDEWIQMAKEIRKAGALGLLLTGGEPMLRPDFVQIYRDIAKMGFVLTLYTNATLVTPEIIKALQEFPPHTIGITTYGASSTTYEKVTGYGDAYYKMLEGVEQLRKLPSKFSIRTTIIKDNRKDLEEIVRWASTYGGDVEFNLSRIVTKQVRGGISDVESCRLTPKQNVAMQVKFNNDFIISPIQQLFEEEAIDNEERNYLLNLLEQKEIKTLPRRYKNGLELYGCDAGKTSFTISWDGKLIGCQLLGDCCTYPFEIGFECAWKQLPDKIKLPEVSEQCKGCSTACCACPATRLAETGSLGGWPEYICRESKLKEEMHNEVIKKIKQIILRKEQVYESI